MKLSLQTYFNCVKPATLVYWGDKRLQLEFEWLAWKSIQLGFKGAWKRATQEAKKVGRMIGR